MENLILLQEEYIEFLEREVGNASLAAHHSGWSCSTAVYIEGCRLRKEIEEAKNSAK